MFIAVSEIAFAVSAFLASPADERRSEPGCYGRAYRHSVQREAKTREIARSYRDARDLAEQLSALDDEFDPTRLTVVVVLDERTRQRFAAAIVRREKPALRLAITTTFGAGPATEFAGDLAARAHSLGWRQIVCDRNCERAVQDSLASTLEGESCVVFRPW